MKKKIWIYIGLFILSIGSIFILSGCNKDMIDTVYTFNYAYIELPDYSWVEGPVDSWRDYPDGDQIQVTINGDTYLTDTTRVVLIKYDKNNQLGE